jgi:uncharacterized SAM-binding protein YcdF (DUF218 family)
MNLNRPGKIFVTIFAAAFAIWLCGFAVFITSAARLNPEKINEETDAIIVLTGGKTRINTGLKLLAEGKSGNLFISGVNEKVGINDIKRMYSDKPELPECCIFLGHKAQNTMNNAAESKKWVEEHGFSSIRLVTSDYHIFRSVMEFRDIMPQIEIVRHPTTELEKWSRPFWSAAAREFNKTLLTWIRQKLKLKVPSKF